MLMEISIDSVDDYLLFLEKLSKIPVGLKDGSLPMSPSVFNGNRSRDNIKSSWSLVIDVDDTDMKPEDFQRIFPSVKMVLISTFSGNGRFRVIIPTADEMDSDTYMHIQKVIFDTVESNGFIDIKKHPNSTKPIHGIDKSKIGPESLFYLPCPAQKSERASIPVLPGAGMNP